MKNKLFLLTVVLLTAVLLLNLVSCNYVEYNDNPIESNMTDGNNDPAESNTTQGSNNPIESNTTQGSNNKTESNTTESNNQSTSEPLEKIYCQATLDDLFSDYELLLVMFPEYNFVEYTVADFEYVGCIEVKDLTIGPTEGKLCKILSLKLGTHSKENVLNVIKTLEQRADVYCAEPNYYMSID